MRYSRHGGSVEGEPDSAPQDGGSARPGASTSTSGPLGPRGDVQDEGTAPFSLEVRQRYVSAFGVQTSAYWNLQDGVSYFDLPGIGFISYFTEGLAGVEVDVVFTRPICSSEHMPRLIRSFIEARGSAPVFAGIDEETATLLGEMGYSVNEFGTEFLVPVQSFTIEGKHMKYLRSVRHLGRRGVEVRELGWSEVDGDEVVRISRSWMRQKKAQSELRILTKPPEFEDAWGVRKFYCFVKGRLEGFVFFEPFFARGECVGYCANILRSRPGVRPNGILDYTILQAMEQFRKEGRTWLALGLAPFFDVRPRAGERWLLRQLIQSVYARGERIYHFRSLAFHKTRYRARQRKMYICLKGISSLTAGAVGAKATGVLVRRPPPLAPPAPPSATPGMRSETEGGLTAEEPGGPAREMADLYGLVAPVYDGLAQIYSLGRIRASKSALVGGIRAGERVLFAGCGGGEDAAEAAVRGADVTVVEISAAMLGRAEKRFSRAGVVHKIEACHEPIRNHARYGCYDVVVASFFLNVFEPEEMRRVLAHLVALLRPGGRLMIADYAPLGGGAMTRTFQWLYHEAAIQLFRVLTRNATHPIYDYTPVLEASGLSIEATGSYALFGQLPWFRTWVARRPLGGLPGNPGSPRS